MEWVKLRQLQIDDFALFHRAGRHLRRGRQLDLRGRGLCLLDRGGLALWDFHTGPNTPGTCFLVLFSTSGHFVQNTGGRGLAKGRLVSLGRAALAGLRPLFRFAALGVILFLWGTAPALCRFFLRLHFFILVEGFPRLFSLDLRRRLGWSVLAHTGDHRLLRLGCRAGASSGPLYLFRDRGLCYSLGVPSRAPARVIQDRGLRACFQFVICHSLTSLF
ncbi:hypothetical protein QKU_1455 [Clostridioides difficile DA00203]|nr:hypothetical protein QKU_1455 [Clostridioides difficile DA00203]